MHHFHYLHMLSKYLLSKKPIFLLSLSLWLEEFRLSYVVLTSLTLVAPWSEVCLHKKSHVSVWYVDL